MLLQETQTALRFWIPGSTHPTQIFPLYSARNCHQTLEPCENQVVFRDIHGDALPLGHKPLKYKSIIKGKDQAYPAFESLMQRAALWVDCAVPFSHPISAGEETAILHREAVPGTLLFQAQDALDMQAIVIQQNGTQISFQPLSSDGFFMYRPRLTMRIVDTRYAYDEWNQQWEWALTLEEL